MKLLAQNQNLHTLRLHVLCAIVSALKLSSAAAASPSHPLEFDSSFLMLFLRISICSLQALIKAVICKNKIKKSLNDTFIDTTLTHDDK